MIRALLAVALLLVAGDALACPYCAGREDGGTAGVLVILGLVATPLLSAGVVAVLIRRVTRRAEREEAR